MKAYSIQDLKTANDILSTDLGTLFPMDFYTWARAVKNFFTGLYNQAKAWAKKAGGYTMAIKAIWANLKAGMSLSEMASKALARVERVIMRRLPEGMMLVAGELRPMSKSNAKKNRGSAQTMTSRSSKNRMWMGSGAKSFSH